MTERLNYNPKWDYDIPGKDYYRHFLYAIVVYKNSGGNNNE